MKLTRFATLGCQKFAKSKRQRGHNSQTKRPIAKISPLLTLQLLILSTGARFKVILCTFKGTFINLFFWFMAPLEGQCGRIGSASRARVANLYFIESSKCIFRRVVTTGFTAKPIIRQLTQTISSTLYPEKKIKRHSVVK